MADRVLNFKEFSDKFSEDAEQNQAASVQNVANAADNFSQGFDEDTYDKSELGPNKPVDIGSEESIAQPGEDGSPSFSSDSEGIESPSDSDEECIDCDEDNIEEEEESDDDTEESEEESDDDIEDDGSYGNPEGDDDEEDDDEDEEDEEEDEDANESFKWSSSKSIILESFDDFEGKAGSLDLSHLDMDSDDDFEYDWREERDMYSDNDVELLFNDDDLDIRDIENDRQDMQDMSDECFVICQKCGATKMVEPGDNPVSSDKINDPDSWWQGAEYGMNCGANPCSK